MEVLLLRRAVRANDFSSDAYVFPGGVVDAADRHAHAACYGLDDAAASDRLHLPEGGLDYYIAAIRECFEETGVLFADVVRGDAGSHRGSHAEDRVAEPIGTPIDITRLTAIRAHREALHDAATDLTSLCRTFDIRLAPNRLHYLSHWVTPLALSKRFDTRFFLAVLPDGQQAEVDQVETAAHRWMRPAYAFAHAEQLRLLPPTRKLLQWLERMGDVDTAVAAAQALTDVPRIQPRLADGKRGRWPVTPDEPAWAELSLTDPQEQGTGSYDIVPGRVVALMPGVLRVSAPNPGMMTGPGTNTYLIGGGPANAWAVIDPGPDDPSHIDAILRAAPGGIRQIFVTHTHRDHSPAARTLAARTGGNDIRDACETRGRSGSDVCAGYRAEGWRCRGVTRWPHFACYSHPGTRGQSSLLRARRSENCLHGRSRHAGLDGRYQPTRRAYGDVSAFVEKIGCARARMARTGVGASGSSPFTPHRCSRL